MSLTDLSIAELQDIMMEETKKLTLIMRGEEDPGEDRDKIRYKIEKIQRILEERKEKNEIS